jgi:small subunit ribosomal protein S13
VARIAGIDLPKRKRSEIGLTYIYGIGRTTARTILGKAGIGLDKRIGDLTDDEVAKIRGIITSEYKVEGSARSETQMNIKRLTDIGCYRGLRHRKGLPVRGQRTGTTPMRRKGREKDRCRKEEDGGKDVTDHQRDNQKEHRGEKLRQPPQQRLNLSARRNGYRLISAGRYSSGRPSTM